jgi:hypothetical protein
MIQAGLTRSSRDTQQTNPASRRRQKSEARPNRCGRGSYVAERG